MASNHECIMGFYFFILFVFIYGVFTIKKNQTLKLTEKCEEASENSTAILVDKELESEA